MTMTATGDRRAAPPLLPPAMVRALAMSARRAAGLLLCGIAAALSVALLSYAPTDPSWNSASAGPATNWLGPVGAQLADPMIQLWGGAAFMPVFVALGWGVILLRARAIGRPVLRTVGLLLAMIFSPLALSGLPDPTGWSGRTDLGGVIGAIGTPLIAGLLPPGDMGWRAVAIPATAAILAALTFIYAIGLKATDWAAGMRGIGRLAAGLGGAAVGTVRGGGRAGGAAVRTIGHGAKGLARVIPRFGLGRGSPPVEPFVPKGDPDGFPPDAESRDDATAPAAGPLPPLVARRMMAGTVPEASGQDDDTDDTDGVERRPHGIAAPDEATEPPRKRPTIRITAPTEGVKPSRRAEAERQSRLPLEPLAEHELPPLDLLALPDPKKQSRPLSEAELGENAEILEGVLGDFGVKGQIVSINPGPVVTLYELEPAPGTKSSRVIGLADDIARSMSAISARVAVVPGKNAIGVELPNARRETVYLREMLASSTFEKSVQKLPLVLGKDIGGKPVLADLARMPHLLVAGTTGSGKSVSINTMILSLLYRFPPDKVRLIMVDPKMLELSVYDDIPHLLTPVVTDPKKAVVALKWAVREMEERYRAMSRMGVRNIEGYNNRLRQAQEAGEMLMRKVQTGFDADTGKPVFEDQPLDLTELPYIVVIVDEMADLMMVAGKDIEAAIQRLAQMARAAGIHLIMATQRPSVDVITGTIKANFPTRISFAVTSKIDSRTILGEGGAEQLLGQGDMLYMAAGGRITRVHGPFVADDEVEHVVEHLKAQGEPLYNDAVTEDEDDGAAFDPDGGGVAGGGSGDDLYDQAVAVVAREGKASTSFIQRHLQIGYNRAARLIERMENEGVVSQANRVGKREVLIGNHAD